MNINKYLERIGFKGKIQINEDCLKELHKCHVMTIPFETFDVQMGEPIDLQTEKIYNKIVLKSRGGYCYELNLLFHSMLTEVGFVSYLISARIFDAEQFGPEFDHMAIAVKLDVLWLVDVGYGDLFLEPIQINPKVQQEDKFKIYKIEQHNSNEYLLWESLKGHVEFRLKYKFKNIPRKLNEFESQNNWKQSSKESYFVKNRICTLPTENGRRTIWNNTYKVKTADKLEQIEIQQETKLIEILKNDFKIEFGKTMETSAHPILFKK